MIVLSLKQEQQLLNKPSGNERPGYRGPGK